MPLSILHVQGRYFAEGGAETYLRGLVAAQKAQGHRVAVLYNSERPEWRNSDSDELFCPPSFGLRTGLRQARTVISEVRAWQPQIVHLHVTQYQMSPLLARALTRRWPTLQTVHDTLFLCFKGIDERALERSARILPHRAPCLQAMGWGCVGAGCIAQLAAAYGWLPALHRTLAGLYRVRASRSVHRLLLNSEFSRGELLRNGFPRARLTVPGIATPLPSAWEATVPETPAEEAEAPLILFVGKLVEAKGVRLFLDALERLADREWRALVVGDGPACAAVEALAMRRGWSARLRVQRALPRDELGTLYRRARLAVFASLWPESWGLAGVEAMWFARPVVAFDSGAVREWLEDGCTGYLVPWGDAAELADRIERLLLDAALARRLGEEARRRAQRWFQLGEHADRVLQAYREVLDERG